METTMQHKFEAAKLGTAPFKYLGMEVRVGPIRWVDAKTGVTCESGAPGQPMGTCAYCLQGIMYCYKVRGSGADDKVFTVGSECVNKVGDAGLSRGIKREQSKLTKSRELERIEALQARLGNAAFRDQLETLPHPNQNLAAQGRTLLGYIDWILERAGHAGKMKVVRMVNKL